MNLAIFIIYISRFLFILLIFLFIMNIIKNLKKLYLSSEIKNYSLTQFYDNTIQNIYNFSKSISVGRSINNDIIINDDTISRLHFTISNVESNLLITNFSKSNGTYVNDHKIEKYFLKNGDVITIGKIKFKFEIKD